MKRWPINHLTAEDLDAFHSASLSVEARAHLDECEECRTMAELDRVVVDSLAALPAFHPREGFADRVVARVRQPAPAVVPMPAPRRARNWGRPAAAAMLVASLGASILWSLSNRDLLQSWIQLASAETGRMLWLGVRVVATNLTAQSWYAPAREFVSSPGRLAALMGGSLVAYGAAVAALRRLLTPPRALARPLCRPHRSGGRPCRRPAPGPLAAGHPARRPIGGSDQARRSGPARAAAPRGGAVRQWAAPAHCLERPGVFR